MISKTRSWHVKELSQLTKVSVRTLHHYDEIGLLKPSMRAINGYRLYAESDVMHLQQILALKFLGFKLSVINKLMNKKLDPLDHFTAQQEMVSEKIASLHVVQELLTEIIQQVAEHPEVSLDPIIHLIEEYHMSKELEKSWKSKVLSPEELKQYAKLVADRKTTQSPSHKESFEKAWQSLIKEIEQNLSINPESDVGRDIGKRCMDLVNPLYQSDHQNLKKAIWDKGFMTGSVPKEEGGVSSEVAQWLDKALSTYHLHQAYKILNEITGPSPSHEIIDAWYRLLNELSGPCEEMQKKVYHVALDDPKIRTEAKEWLRSQLA